MGMPIPYFCCHVSVAVALVIITSQAQAWNVQSIASTSSRQHKSLFTTTSLASVSHDLSAEEALARTQAHLKKLQQQQRSMGPRINTSEELHPQQQQSIQQETAYRQYLLQSANALKQELKQRKLPTQGRKPDLARRLVQHDAVMDGTGTVSSPVTPPLVYDDIDDDEDDAGIPFSARFAGIPLSQAGTKALYTAGFLDKPTGIQSAAIPLMMKGDSVLIHAETGSGKTLAYCLPITEQLWAQQTLESIDTTKVGVILTPTRELAAQVAGIASVLAPPGTVRLMSHPSNLAVTGVQERGEAEFGGRVVERDVQPRLIVSSAKTFLHSLYGNENLPAPPTPKPAALAFLKSVGWLILDEVDRLLPAEGKSKNKGGGKRHEKPAAVIAAAVARHTLGRAQIVAASATVGRPLKRELARVLGLSPLDCPQVVRAVDGEEDVNQQQKASPSAQARAVTIPGTVDHYVCTTSPPAGSNNNNQSSDNGAASTSSGQSLTRAYQVIQALAPTHPRMLLVLSRGFGISTQNVIGALSHFNCQPSPKSLLDALQQQVDGTDQMIQVHRQVSGATGVGESLSSSSSQETEDDETVGPEGYLLVTGEDTIRGLHLDGLDVVLVIGRPNGPDEYTHIAGRTGRAGRPGKVINVVSPEHATLLKSWESMLQIKFDALEDLDTFAKKQ